MSTENFAPSREAMQEQIQKAYILVKAIVQHNPFAQHAGDWGQTAALMEDALYSIAKDGGDPNGLLSILAVAILPEDDPCYPHNQIAFINREQTGEAEYPLELEDVQTLCADIVPGRPLPAIRNFRRTNWHNKVDSLTDYFLRIDQGPDIIERIHGVLTGKQLPLEGKQKKNKTHL